jgi:dsRNA-specific ribonuclease
VAEAWFGERVDAALLARFVERLVELDLVRRHDERRNYLWVLSPAESSRLVDEAEQAQTLKAHNPKGRLLEHCMRLRIPSPAVEWGTEGAYHTARMRLEQDGTVFDSGTRYASERVTAEQLAARRVLELCEEHERAELDGAIVDISDEQAIALKASNPKGRLLEEAARRKSAAPRLEARVIAGRWCCRVRLPSDTGESHSRWYRAASKVIAEQGAASEVVSKLSEQPPDTTEKDDAGEGQQHPPASEPHGKDPRITLNELRQRRYLDDFGYELVDRGGPPHAPRFTVRAWARTGEQSVLSEPCTGSSKKEAERRAAADLVGRIAG